MQINTAPIKDAHHYLGAMTCDIDFFKKGTVTKERFDTTQLARQLVDTFRNQVS